MNQMELNEELYVECHQDNINLDKIQKLIDNGAQPLGPIYGAKDEHVYGELICFDTPCLFEITKLFLKNGMKIIHSDYRNDGEDIDPMWFFALKCDLDGIKALKELLDYQTDVNSVSETIEHVYDDYIFLEYDRPESNEEYIKALNEDESWSYGIKMLMLCLSYDYVFDACELIRNVMDIEHNKFDRHNFREYENYYVKAESKQIDIFDKETNQRVWIITI